MGRTGQRELQCKWIKNDARNLCRTFANLSFGIILASPSIAEQATCADEMFVVESRSGALASQICSLAAEITHDLAACGLSQEKSLTIKVSRRLSHPLGDCLGYFDCEHDQINITEPALLPDILADDSAYSVFPTKVLLRAVLTHELSHALAAQKAGRRQIPPIDQEYIAAAIELEFMDRTWRTVLLEAASVAPPAKRDLIDIWVYHFMTQDFIVNAWRHFREQENGCELIMDLISGKASFESQIK